MCTWILHRDKCSQKSNTTETEETITGLGEYPYHWHAELVKSVITNYTDPGVPYRVNVTAYTSAGPGPESTLNEIIFTKELPPEQTVTNITIKWINATTVNISWIPLGIHQARGFPSYRVTIFREGTPLKNRTTNDSRVFIGQLNNNRLYRVTVKLITGGGEGRQSEPGTLLHTINLNNFHTRFLSSSDLWIPNSYPNSYSRRRVKHHLGNYYHCGSHTPNSDLSDHCHCCIALVSVSHRIHIRTCCTYCT